MIGLKRILFPVKERCDRDILPDLNERESERQWRRRLADNVKQKKMTKMDSLAMLGKPNKSIRRSKKQKDFSRSNNGREEKENIGPPRTITIQPRTCKSAVMDSLATVSCCEPKMFPKTVSPPLSMVKAGAKSKKKGAKRRTKPGTKHTMKEKISKRTKIFLRELKKERAKHVNKGLKKTSLKIESKERAPLVQSGGLGAMFGATIVSQSRPKKTTCANGELTKTHEIHRDYELSAKTRNNRSQELIKTKKVTADGNNKPAAKDTSSCDGASGTNPRSMQSMLSSSAENKKETSASEMLPMILKAKKQTRRKRSKNRSKRSSGPSRLLSERESNATKVEGEEFKRPKLISDTLRRPENFGRATGEDAEVPSVATRDGTNEYYENGGEDDGIQSTALRRSKRRRSSLGSLSDDQDIACKKMAATLGPTPNSANPARRRSTSRGGRKKKQDETCVSEEAANPKVARRSKRQKAAPDRFGMFGNESTVVYSTRTGIASASQQSQHSNQEQNTSKRQHKKQKQAPSEKHSVQLPGGDEPKKQEKAQPSMCLLSKNWTQEELTTLRQSHRDVDPTSTLFWEEISEKVKTQSAEACREKWFSFVETPVQAATRCKQKQQSHHPALQTTMTSFEDDIFDATPMKALFGIPSNGVGNGMSGFGIHGGFGELQLGSAIKVQGENQMGMGMVMSPKRLHPGTHGYKTYIKNVKRDVKKSAKLKLPTLPKQKTNKNTLSFKDGEGGVEVNGKLSPGGTLRVRTDVDDMLEILGADAADDIASEDE